MKQVKEIKIGDKFGKWEVESLFRDPKSRKLRCDVKCQCGNVGNVIAYNLLNGSTKGCHPCSLKENAELRRSKMPKIGDKNGKWTIVDTYISSNGKTKAKLKCECGNTKECSISDIKSAKMCMKCKGLAKKGLKLERARKGLGELSGTYWNAIQRGAEARKLDFDITIQQAWDLFIKQDKKCSLSGIDIKLGYKYVDGEQTASLDRIDNTKGYIKGNVQWLHKDINNMKHAHTQEYFITLCKSVSQNN